MTLSTSGGRPIGFRSAVNVVASQAASSLGNLMLLIAVSRTGTAEDLGQVAIVSICYQIMLGVARAMLGEVALVRTAVVGRLQGNEMIRSSWLIGGSAGILLLVASAAFDLELLAILALFAPWLVAQDSLRYLAFAERRSVRAARADIAWLVAFMGFVFMSSAIGRSVNVDTFVAVWCLSGAASILLVDRSTALRSVRTRSRWIRDSRSVVSAYLPDYVLGLVTSVLPTLCVATLGGLADVGGLRLAMGYLGPVTILWTATMNLAVPALSGIERHDFRIEARLSIAGAGIVALWTIVALLVPSSVGERLAGGSWGRATEWIPWLGVGFVVVASGGGAVVGLRTSNRAAAVLRVRVWLAPMSLIAPIGGFLIAGPAGFGIGITVVSVMASILLWSSLLGGGRERSVPPRTRASRPQHVAESTP